MSVRDDRVLFYGLWLFISYALACYLFFGALAVSAPTPHPGSGVLVFGWLLSPSFPFYAVGTYIEKGFPEDQLTAVLTFTGVLLICLIVIGRLLRVPLIVRSLKRLMV
jgi:hypothetical protein